jgi:hypothetical protein
MIKKPSVRFENRQPRNLQRTDLAPASGCAIIVDGHFKTQFLDESAANDAAKKLLSSFPRLRIEVYDAAAGARTLIK